MVGIFFKKGPKLILSTISCPIFQDYEYEVAWDVHKLFNRKIGSFFKF